MLGSHLPLLLFLDAHVEWPVSGVELHSHAVAARVAAMGNRTRATTIVLIPQELFANVAWSASLPQITLAHSGLADHHEAAVQLRLRGRSGRVHERMLSAGEWKELRPTS